MDRHAICDRGARDNDIGGNGFGNHRLEPRRRPRGGGRPDLAVLPAAADEVSASIAQLFSQHAANYQATAAQAAAFQEQFVQNLTASAGSYAGTEAAIASFLQDMPEVVLDGAVILLALPTLLPLALLLALL